mmetsp:Transcript_20487/g.44466  ORF Transcript_20487/g.44466 Transcript_20487/m.44466 type:complete len:458 (-) Transcript_20487:200-1573(-)
MNHHGNYHPAGAAGYQPHAPLPLAPQPYAATSMPQQGGQPVTVFTCRDVLNGRGQGVQRHPGNMKYRTLVFVNKGLYAKCPRPDKMKISKGIVAAVREMGGGFLELDERTGTYKDIGDKKATEKTSQALREGQTKIRKQMYKDEEKGGNQTYDTSLLGSAAKGPGQREISAQGYFGYSVQVLESLYNAEENDPDAIPPTAVVQPAAPQLTIANSVPSSSAARISPAAMAMVLDQFPGAVSAPAASQMQMLPPPPLPPVNHAQDADIRLTNPSMRFTETGRPSLSGRHSLSRLTNRSLMSMFSINSNSLRQLVDWAGSESNWPVGDESNQLSAEIRSCITESKTQLWQAENNTMDDTDTHENEEVVTYDENTMKDRVSELRFTDVGSDGIKYEGDPNQRFTESTRDTNSSLMDASMMTIPTDDMSIISTDRKYKAGDFASAELLLRLSGDNNGKSHQV